MHQFEFDKMSVKPGGSVLPILRKCTFVILVLSITCGCFWQIASVCDLFFRYPTNVYMKTRFDVFEKDLPAMTFCMSRGRAHYGRSSDDLFANYSYKDYIQDISIRFNEEESHTNLDYYLDNVVEFISLKYYCFTINSLQLVNQSIVLEENSSLRIKLTSQRTLFLMMHSAYDQTSYNHNTVEFRHGFWQFITFSHQSYHLLASPYPTDCRNYQTTSPFKSRKDCIRKCKISRSLAECGVVSNFVDVMRGEPEVRFAANASEQLCVTRLDLKKLCAKTCANTDCIKHYYNPKIIATGKMAHMSKRDVYPAEVKVFIPTEPQTTYHHKPSIESIEFFIFLASTLSIWFGFSVLSTVDYLRSVANSFSANSVRKYIKSDTKDRMVFIKDCVVNILNSNR